MLAGATVLRSYQARVYRALLATVLGQRNVTATVIFPRQAGKNEVAAHLTAALLRLHAAAGGTVVACAPTRYPQADIGFTRLVALLRATDPLFPAWMQSAAAMGRVRVGRAEAVFLSGDPSAHVAGHTASLALLADEAQELDEEHFERQFRPMAAAFGAPVILFGTPWDGTTLLDKAAAANRERDAAQPGEPYRDFLPLHHEVTWREVAAANPAFGAFVRAERARLGANHPLFLTQYEVRPAARSGGMFTPGQLALLEGGHRRLPGPLPGEQYVAGLDFGGQGADADRTVLTIGRVTADELEVVEHAAWQGVPYERLLREAEAVLRRWRVERVAADATGLGSPLAAALERSLGRRVEPVVFAPRVKSELGYQLLAAAETGRLRLYAFDGSPEAAAVRQELRALRASFAGRWLRWGNERGHDDFAVSLALCLRAAHSLGPPRVAVGRSRG